MHSYLRLSAIGLVLALTAGTAQAQGTASAESFYKGKTVKVLCPFSAKGGYGFITRMIADYLPKYLPGQPKGIPQFMPGATGKVEAGFLYNVAPRDGSVIALMYDGIPTAQVTDSKKPTFDARKFIVLGSINHGLTGALGVWKTTGVKTIADAKKKQVVLGAVGPTSIQYIVPHVLNETIGTKFKIIPGYKGTGNLFLAMERGELEGVFTNYITIVQHHADWIKQKRFYWLGQLGNDPIPSFKGVPMLYTLPKSKIDRETLRFLIYSRATGKAVIAPPGVPAAQVSALRAAFSAMVKDKEFIQRMKKTRRFVNPRTWREARDLIHNTVNTKPEVLARVRELTTVKK